MERKLRLVPREPEISPDEGAITDEERAAAEALRDALDRGDAPLADELRAAFAPRDLAGDDLDAIVARALGDEAAATAHEREAAERLRAELEGEAPVREAAVFEAIRAAARPAEIDRDRHEAMIRAALARAGRRGIVRRLAPVTIVVVTGVTAIAAGLALFFGQLGQPRVDASAAMIRARSAQELFDASTPFPRSGDESARVDRIAAARAGDLRANRFAAWGVR